MQQILAPWAWLLPENRNKAVTEFDKNWMNSPTSGYISGYELIDHSWQIIDLPVPVAGCVTNLDYLDFLFYARTIEKILLAGSLNYVSPEAINPKDHKIHIIFTARFLSSEIEGMVIIFYL